MTLKEQLIKALTVQVAKLTEVHFELNSIRSEYQDQLCYMKDSVLESAEMEVEDQFHSIEAVITSLERDVV